MFDLLIKNGTLIDGTGSPRRQADVAVRGDRIAAVDPLPDSAAAQTIDAAGMIVAPGFIDMHSHADYTLLISPTANSKVAQGVTFELVGNCGASPAPIDDSSREEAKTNSLLGGDGLDWEWDTFENFQNRLREIGTSVNVGMLVGHSAIRSLVIGEGDQQPDADQLQRMKAEVAKAMQAGAFGLSTGLIYPPSVYAGTDEIVALAECAAREGGIYASHIRGEADTVLEAVDEAIEIGRRANIPVEISHLKTQNPRNWPKMSIVLEKIERARAEGLNVSADMYPYTACSTSLSALVKPWAHVDGKNALLGRLKGPERERIYTELASLDVQNGPGYWERTVVCFCPGFPENDGKSIAEIAAGRKSAPEQAVIELLLETGGMAEMIQFLMTDDNVALGLRAPWVMIGSDGEGRSTEGLLALGKPHPRNYGTFPRVLGHFSRDLGLFPLEEAIRKMTGLPGEKLGLKDRGLVRPGYYADLVVFHPDQVTDRATFAQPHQYPAGIPFVIVNGKVVISEGTHTLARPGKVVLRQ
jgi:N-acyl-D-amino-acid deacylase